MTARAARPRRSADSDVPMAELRHYSIQETADLLGVSKRWLAGKVAAREVACTFIAGQAKFTAVHIRLLSAAGEINPDAIGRKRTA
ncbi:hypothetical protein [Kitasatospora sp. MBT66]|uniref:hypothetical protein n=1 Tax=Kitasatospora sp. MBT66 TaxID=1444769 RepID=UPI0005BE8860|nr:hypothetical protein [Kitasatospora sp. MBT66]